MNVLPELWAFAAWAARRTARLLVAAATLLALAACGPGTGGTGTGPVNGAVNFSGAGFSVGAPCTQYCGGADLRLENERVELTIGCRRFVFAGLWEIDAQGMAVLSGTLEATEFVDGQAQASTVAAEMRLQFSDTRANSSREVVVTVRDAQGNLLVAPQRLEQQQPEVAAPESCTPTTR